MPHRILFWTDRTYPERYVGSGKLYPKHAIKAVVNHLKGGEVSKAGGPLACMLCDCELSLAERTDGEVVWPENAQHYITAHGVWAPEHIWLAERLLLNRQGPPPGRRRRAPGTPSPSDDQVVPTEDARPIQSEEDELARAVINEWVGSVKPEPTNTDAVTVTKDAVESWQFDDAVLGQMAEEALSMPPARSILPERAVLPREDAVEHRTRRRIVAHPRTSRHQRLDDQQSDDALREPPRERPRTTALVPVASRENEIHQARYGAGEAEAIAQAYPVGWQLAAKVVEVANRIGAHPFDLANVINFKSGATWQPDVRNNTSGATGLIQFYPGLTKKRLGIDVDQLSRLSAVEQMDWVRAYFDSVRGTRPLDTEHKVALAVFYPKAIDWPTNQSFPPDVTRNNPGIYTPDDYVTLVRKFARLPGSSGRRQQSQSAAVTGGGGGGLWSDLTSWLGGLLGGSPTQPMAPPSAQVPAHWTVDPQLPPVRLTSGGRSVVPGAVAPGDYQLDLWHENVWKPIASVHLNAGRKYLVRLEGTRLTWTES